MKGDTEGKRERQETRGVGTARSKRVKNGTYLKRHVCYGRIQGSRGSRENKRNRAEDSESRGVKCAEEWGRGDQLKAIGRR